MLSLLRRLYRHIELATDYNNECDNDSCTIFTIGDKQEILARIEQSRMGGGCTGTTDRKIYLQNDLWYNISETDVAHEPQEFKLLARRQRH